MGNTISGLVRGSNGKIVRIGDKFIRSTYTPIPTNGLIGYYKFEQNFEDSGTGHNDLNEAGSNGWGWTNGKRGIGVKSTYSTSDRKTAYGNATINALFSGPSLSVSLWAIWDQQTGAGNQSAWRVDESDWNLYQGGTPSAGRWEVKIRNSGTTVFINGINHVIDENYEHLVVTFDQDISICTLYRNSVVDGSVYVPGVPQGGIFSVVNVYPGAVTSLSDIDELMIYDRVLSLDEIEDLYNNGSGI